MHARASWLWLVFCVGWAASAHAIAQAEQRFVLAPDESSALFDTGLTHGIPDEMAAMLTRDAAFPKRMGRPEEYAQLAKAIFETPMLNGGTIRLDGGQRFAPK